MAVHTARGSYTRPQQRVAKSNEVDAPIRGIDSRTILSRGDPLHCIYTYNMVPDIYGMRVRQGYREHAINLDNGSGIAIGTIITFGGADNNQTDDRLFAVSNEGIWDVTTQNDVAPTLVLDFSNPANGGDTSQEAGYGVYTDYTTLAGDQYIFYADSKNGLFQYEKNTDTWSRKSDVTGPVAENIYFVVVHKRQLWFVEEDSNNAWYLPAGSIAGNATEFSFGAKLKHGGNLAGLFSWTIDGGEGLDDYLVAVGREGDVIPYLGTDPSDANAWFSKGAYFIGAVPKGTQFATEQGGDLRILSSFGVISMNDLLQGVDGKDVQALTQTLKIASFIRPQLAALRTEDGWDTKFLPSIGSYIIKSPRDVQGNYTQYVENVTTTGWGIWRDVRMTAVNDWNSTVFFGTDDLRVMRMDVNLDDVQIAPADPENNGQNIDWSLLTTFQSWGEPTVFKRVKYIRAQFLIGKAAISQSSQARYDFDLGEATVAESPPNEEGALWDIAIWDTAIWADDSIDGLNDLSGAWGNGRYVAIASRGKSNTETFLIGWDVVWDSGNPV